MKLADRIALVTGGGRGIGRAVAFAFAREGARVAVVARTETEVERVAAQIREECKVEATYTVCDVADASDVARAYSQVTEVFRREPDIVVNNAASIAGKSGAPYVAAYTASKHGVLGLTRSAAMEVATKGVTVNAVCPGYVETDMAEHAIENITAKTGKS